jgi:7-cyano-7-deazaguanine synthase in queuosine biosynthesis
LIEEVVLFSGGLDSLAGAVKESVIDKRRVLLVNHRTTEKLTPRHQHLLRTLLAHASDRKPMHIPVRINKVKGLGREYTQRSRSFVFASLGATIATMIGLNRIRFYENGVVSLNLPPSAQVVGARATRTTHPQILNGFAKLLSQVAGRPFAVENPFIWNTKTEVVKLIGDAGCGDLIRFSTSCTHTWEMTKQHTHCGKCSQCIDRRFAVLAAAQETHDPAEAYKVDLLIGERDDGDPKTMIAAYLETANEINTMSAMQFFSKYGEATRVFRQFDGSAETTAINVFELYKRQARHVTGIVDQAIIKHAAAIRTRKLPSSCLVRLVCDSASTGDGHENLIPVVNPKKHEVTKNAFRKKGEAWVTRFAGGSENFLLPSKGAAYLHALLSHPHRPISAVELACRVARHPKNFALGSAGETLDQDALTAYRARLAELTEELQEAKENNDVAQQTRVEREQEEFMSEIRRALGRGGRIRRDADDRDRVRKAVGNAIRRAIRDIGRFDQTLAVHLHAYVSCGLNPCYSPNRETEWET